jgi:oxygen-independent coproporphyrinogen-3 oxidase
LLLFAFLLLQEVYSLATSVYIHIPFCRRRCHYCDFPIEVVGNSVGTKKLTIDEYIEVLCWEIGLTPSREIPLETVFFGGGTPSLLSPPQLARILTCLRERFGIATDAEISIEIDPGTFDAEKLRGYQESGVTRLSLGVQAFKEELLKICGRSHSVTDIDRSVEIIHRVGMANYSLDLISGLPQQTITDWEDALQKAIALQPQHLSCYDLVLEETTVFGKRYRSGEKPLPSDETAAQMYRLASQTLREAGYEHYEISNYAKKGDRCRHNLVYWENRPYYGFGMGAASYIDNKRFTRPQKKTDYFLWVEELAKNGGNIDISPLSRQDIFLETLMLGLRLTEGVDLMRLNGEFGKETIDRLQKQLEAYISKGWVEWDGREAVGGGGRGGCERSSPDSRPCDGGSRLSNRPREACLWHRIRLQDPEGFLFSNTILATLFAGKYCDRDDRSSK